VTSIIADIIGGIVQETLGYVGKRLWKRWVKPAAVRDHTMTCTVCGRERTVQGARVAYWKEHSRKPRRCKVCRRMTLHKLSPQARRNESIGGQSNPRGATANS
jgi:hypothetical protein